MTTYLLAAALVLLLAWDVSGWLVEWLDGYVTRDATHQVQRDRDGRVIAVIQTNERSGR